jgi:hypothetical protein
MKGYPQKLTHVPDHYFMVREQPSSCLVNSKWEKPKGVEGKDWKNKLWSMCLVRKMKERGSRDSDVEFDFLLKHVPQRKK